MITIEQYGIFLLQVVTIVFAIIAVIAFIAAKAQQAKAKIEKGELKISKLNDDFEHYQETIKEAMLDKDQLKLELKALKAQKKKDKKQKRSKENEQKRKRLFVIDFHGDIKASAVDSLREEVNAVLLSATVDDEILVRIESGGGMVNAYGLAASQLHRIRTAKIPLTVAIDKVAASGGYMMACVANHIIAAPFAIVGSIGVLAQIPNFHRWLKQHHIEFEQITAGEYKRTLTLFGENDNKGRQKMQADIDDIHTLFKDFIAENREKVDLDEVATGEYWFGSQAIDLKLVDALQTSDDYLLTANENCDIYNVSFQHKVPAMKKLFQRADSALLKWRNAENNIEENHLLK